MEHKLSDFLTSQLLLTLVMLSVLVGISIHMASVFGSWWLGIGYQSIVLLTSVNSHLLIKIRKDSHISVIPYIVTILTFWLLYIEMGGLDLNLSTTDRIVVVTKAGAISFMEFIFSFLFTNRNRERLHTLAQARQTDTKANQSEADQEHIQRYAELSKRFEDQSKQFAEQSKRLRQYEAKAEILSLKRASHDGKKWSECPEVIERINNLEKEVK